MRDVSLHSGNKITSNNKKLVFGYVRKIQLELKLLYVATVLMELINMYFCSADFWLKPYHQIKRLSYPHQKRHPLIDVRLHDTIIIIYQIITRRQFQKIADYMFEIHNADVYEFCYAHKKFDPIEYNVMLCNTITTGTYKWTFKIKTLYEFCTAKFGIFSKSTDKYFCFVTDGTREYCGDDDNIYTLNDYKCKGCSEGDVVEMILNCTNHSLSFLINCKLRYTFLNIDDDSYTAGVFAEVAFNKEASFELIYASYI